MFTGIIETLGTITNIVKDKENIHLTVKSNFTHELKIDQSVAHNGVCLTVVAINKDEYTVTAIKETLDKTTIGSLSVFDLVNLERGMKLGDRLDGHIVQGHVDQTATVATIEVRDGSWMVHFNYNESADMTSKGYVTVEKGSVCINGVSLTVVDSAPGRFSVTLIPYTWEHTNFHELAVGKRVNIEFDIIGKYVARMIGERAN